MQRRSFSPDEKQIVQEIANVANILSAIYLYRQNASLEAVLAQSSHDPSGNMHESLQIVWGYLQRMDHNEIADLAIETIIDSIDVCERLAAA